MRARWMISMCALAGGAFAACDMPAMMGDSFSDDWSEAELPAGSGAYDESVDDLVVLSATLVGDYGGFGAVDPVVAAPVDAFANDFNTHIALMAPGPGAWGMIVADFYAYDGAGLFAVPVGTSRVFASDEAAVTGCAGPASGGWTAEQPAFGVEVTALAVPESPGSVRYDITAYFDEDGDPSTLTGSFVVTGR